MILHSNRVCMEEKCMQNDVPIISIRCVINFGSEVPQIS